MKYLLSFILVTYFFTMKVMGQETNQSPGLYKADPLRLKEVLLNPHSPKPVIFNVGPMSLIKTAVAIGPAYQKESIVKLKAAALKHPYEQVFIVYCGCCTLDNCPNVKPAVETLKSIGYKNVKVLNLPTGLAEDWIQKDYPMN